MHIYKPKYEKLSISDWVAILNSDISDRNPYFLLNGFVMILSISILVLSISMVIENLLQQVILIIIMLIILAMFLWYSKNLYSTELEKNNLIYLRKRIIQRKIKLCEIQNKYNKCFKEKRISDSKLFILNEFVLPLITISVLLLLILSGNDGYIEEGEYHFGFNIQQTTEHYENLGVVNEFLLQYDFTEGEGSISFKPNPDCISGHGAFKLPPNSEFVGVKCDEKDCENIVCILGNSYLTYEYDVPITVSAISFIFKSDLKPKGMYEFIFNSNSRYLVSQDDLRGNGNINFIFGKDFKSQNPVVNSINVIERVNSFVDNLKFDIDLEKDMDKSGKIRNYCKLSLSAIDTHEIETYQNYKGVGLVLIGYLLSKISVRKK